MGAGDPVAERCHRGTGDLRPRSPTPRVSCRCPTSPRPVSAGGLHRRAARPRPAP